MGFIVIKSFQNANSHMLKRSIFSKNTFLNVHLCLVENPSFDNLCCIIPFIFPLKLLKDHHHNCPEMIHIRQPRRNTDVSKTSHRRWQRTTLGSALVEADTYSLWQGGSGGQQGFNYLFSLLTKVHVRWVSRWGLSVTSSIPPSVPTGSWRSVAGNSSCFS